MRIKKDKKYHLIRQCCICKGIVGITWLADDQDDVEEMHQKVSHCYCHNCLINLYEKDE